MERIFVARIKDEETGKTFVGICEPYVYMTKYVINVKFIASGYLYKMFSEGLLSTNSKEQRCRIEKISSTDYFIICTELLTCYNITGVDYLKEKRLSKEMQRITVNKLFDGMAMLNDELFKSQKILQLIIFKKGGNVKIDIDMNFDLCSLPESTMYEKWAEMLHIPKIKTGKKL